MQESHRYRIVLDDGTGGRGECIDMEGAGPEIALYWAERRLPQRGFELFQDGKSLCHVRQSRKAGYWTIEPPRSLKRAG